MKLLLLAGLIFAAGPALAQPDPLAPARSGKVLCFQPDRQAKSCRSIVAYSFGTGGTVSTRAETLMGETGPLIMTRTGRSTVRRGLVCGKIDAGQIDTAEFTMAGRPMSARDTQALRGELRKEYAELIGKELCSQYTAEGDRLQVRVYLDEAPQADVSDTAVWVDPKAGFRVWP